MVNAKMTGVMEEAKSLSHDEEAWGGHIRLRAKELEALFSSYPFKKTGRMLELGCGNAFSSAVFSGNCDLVVATDLADYDIGTHSIGLDKARRLLKRLGVGNCLLTACSGETIPFKDGSFDLVFSMYVLEHIKDKRGAVKEMARVLKKDGLAVSVLPNFTERIFYPLCFYKYVFNRALKRITGEWTKKGASTERKEDGKGGPVKKSFRESYPNFPFPEPHGAYRNYSQEVAKQLPSKWTSLFRDNGFRVADLFSTMVMPWNFLSFFGDEIPLLIYEKTLPLHVLMGRLPLIKYFGSNIVVIARKSDG